MIRQKRTVQEKYEYNKRKSGDDFAEGYVFGVEVYRQYGSCPADLRKMVKEINRGHAAAAKSDRNRRSIGYMCALRDCANERKGK